MDQFQHGFPAEPLNPLQRQQMLQARALAQISQSSQMLQQRRYSEFNAVDGLLLTHKFEVPMNQRPPAEPLSVIPTQIPSSNVPSQAPSSLDGSILKCPKCPLYHLPSHKCPPLARPVQIRLALDGIKTLSGGDPPTIKKNKNFLQALLKGGCPPKNPLRESDSLPLSPQILTQPSQTLPADPQLGQPIQQPPVPQPPQQPISVQQARPIPPAPASVQSTQQPQMEQARLSAPDDESSSESESESGSGEEDEEQSSGEE